MRMMMLGGAVLILATMGAQAQQSGGDRLLRDPYITGTGATVDKPGEPQASGTTPLDRGIQRQDNKIDNSICKGC